MLTEWALLGLGITFKPLFEIAEHLRSGALVQVLPEFPPQPATLAILYPYRRMVPTKVRLFADMLVEEARAHIANALREPLPDSITGMVMPHLAGMRPETSRPISRNQAGKGQAF